MYWQNVAVKIGLGLVVLLVCGWVIRRRAAMRVRLTDEQVQSEVVAYIAETMPALIVVEEKPREIRMHNPTGEEATMFLDNLIAAVRSTDGSVGERRRVYGEFTRPLGLYAGLQTAAPIAEQKTKLFPRLVHREYLEQLGEAVHRRIGETPLHIAYVIDDQEAVRFIQQRDLQELEMTAEQLDGLAIENFRSMMPEESFRQIMEKPGAASVISSGDSYDATRLILIPEYLRPGEVLAVAVPDRDTMVIVPKPDEKSWDAMAMIAAKPMSSRVMLARPLRVTAMGIEVR